MNGQGIAGESRGWRSSELGSLRIHERSASPYASHQTENACFAVGVLASRLTGVTGGRTTALAAASELARIRLRVCAAAATCRLL